MGASSAIPVIDLFSGPGGLGEGFAQVVDRHGNRVFRIALSIEMDRYAHQTLQLRSFFRQFPPGEVAGDYYKYLRGDRLFPSQDALFSRYERQGRAAMLEAWQATLGETPPSAVSRRINEALQGHSKTKPWVLIGGPPCQAYSLVGRSRMLPEKGHSEFYKDKRHTLYREYLRLVRGHRPTIFIMENVKGLLSSRLNDSLIVESILRDLRRPSTDLKYRLVALSAGQAQLFAQDADLEAHTPEDFLLRAEQYGVPQCRHRLIIMGIRQEFASSSVGAPSPLRHESRQSSCGAAIADLPPLRSGVSRAADSADVWLTAIRSATQAKWIRQLRDHGRSGLVESVLAAIDEVQAPECDRGARFIPSVIRPKCLRPWFCDEKLRGACNHESRSHIQMDLWRYLFAACFGATCGSSPRICDFPRALLPSHANVREAIDSGKFNDRFRVQVADRPATTITAHISKDGHYFIHPDPRQVRSLTVREAARLQTFPDNYFFEGPRTEQYRQVGNAVPPLLAFKVARAIASYLCPGSIGDLGVGPVKAVLRA